jgi:hypothetical protein
VLGERPALFVIKGWAGMITIWAGYVAAEEARVYFIAFDGERIGGLTLTEGKRVVERTFYRVHDGRVVVHEVRSGRRRGGRTYDQALAYVFRSVDEACWSLAVNQQRIDPTRGEATLPRVEAQTLTLDEWMSGAGTY